MTRSSIKKRKKPVPDWEKVFFTTYPQIKIGQDLVSRVYKEFLKFPNKKTTKFFKIGEKLKEIPQKLQE
jgi:hypothetical protein